MEGERKGTHIPEGVEGFEGKVEFDAERVLNGERLSIEALEQSIEKQESLERLWQSALGSALSYCATVDRHLEFEGSSAKFHLDVEDYQSRILGLDRSRRDSHQGTLSAFRAFARNLEASNPVLSEKLMALLKDEDHVDRNMSSTLFLDIAMQEKMRRAAEVTEQNSQ